MELSDQIHAPVALPLGKEPPPHSLNRRLGGPQSRSGCGERFRRNVFKTEDLLTCLFFVTFFLLSRPQ
jgi:hypothetical protein